MVIEKMFKEIDAEIGIEKIGEDKAPIRIKASAREKNGIGLSLKKGEREILFQLFGGGYALFEDVPLGGYEILFFSTKGLQPYTFEVRESIHG